MIGKPDPLQPQLFVRQHAEATDHPLADRLPVIDVLEVVVRGELVAGRCGVADDAVRVGAAVQLHPHADGARVLRVRDEADLGGDGRGPQVVGRLHVRVTVAVEVSRKEGDYPVVCVRTYVFVRLL